MVPPKERVDLGVAKLLLESYMSGKVTLKEIMETLGTRKVCFVAPEGNGDSHHHHDQTAEGAH